AATGLYLTCFGPLTILLGCLGFLCWWRGVQQMKSGNWIVALGTFIFAAITLGIALYKYDTTEVHDAEDATAHADAKRKLDEAEAASKRHRTMAEADMEGLNTSQLTALRMFNRELDEERASDEQTEKDELKKLDLKLTEARNSNTFEAPFNEY